MKVNVNVNEKQLKAIYDKLKGIEGLEKEFHEQLKATAKETRNKARADFEQRSGDPSGLVRNIRFRTIKRKKGKSAYMVDSGADKEPIMAYIEFGTRSRPINTSGIVKLFGSARGRRIALSFKRNGAKKNQFTHRNAKPYFFLNAYYSFNKFKRIMRKKIKNAVRK